MAALTAVAALVVAAERRESFEPATGRYGHYAQLVIVLAVLGAIGLHGWLADRRLRDASRRAVTARRWGMVAGVVLGAVGLAASVPTLASSTWWGRLLASLALPCVAMGNLIAGVVAARSSGERRTGSEAGVWAGRVAGLVLAIGLLATTLWATGWYVHSAATVRAYRDTFPGAHFASYHTHFHTIVGFVLSENIDNAVSSSLLLYPFVGWLFGTLGGALEPAGRGPGGVRIPDKAAIRPGPG